jgi:hypothetical protein
LAPTARKKPAVQNTNLVRDSENCILAFCQESLTVSLADRRHRSRMVNHEPIAALSVEPTAQTPF